MVELLNELRVALPGVQILFAFLLTVPFSQLCALAAALGGSVLLITDLMFDGIRVWLYPGVVLVLLVGLWFVRPLLRQARGKSSGP